MIIGICSDIHGSLSPAAYEALEGVDHILCAGDIERSLVLMELETIAPVTCVRGNCDSYEVGDVPFTTTVTLEGLTFFMVHRPQDIGNPPAGTDVVVHGHTHVPRDEQICGIRFLNPGSTRRPRGGSGKSLLRLTVQDGTIQDVTFVDLDRPVSR